MIYRFLGRRLQLITLTLRSGYFWLRISPYSFRSSLFVLDRSNPFFAYPHIYWIDVRITPIWAGRWLTNIWSGFLTTSRKTSHAQWNGVRKSSPGEKISWRRAKFLIIANWYRLLLIKNCLNDRWMVLVFVIYRFLGRWQQLITFTLRSRYFSFCTCSHSFDPSVFVLDRGNPRHIHSLIFTSTWGVPL